MGNISKDYFKPLLKVFNKEIQDKRLYEEIEIAKAKAIKRAKEIKAREGYSIKDFCAEATTVTIDSALSNMSVAYLEGAEVLEETAVAVPVTTTAAAAETNIER